MSYLPTTALPTQMPWLTSTVTTDPTRWPYTNNKRSWFIRSDPTNYAISANAEPFRGFFDFSFLRVTPPKQQPYSLLIFLLALLFLQPKNDRIVDFYLDSGWVNTLPREFMIHCHTLLCPPPHLLTLQTDSSPYWYSMRSEWQQITIIPPFTVLLYKTSVHDDREQTEHI